MPLENSRLDIQTRQPGLETAPDPLHGSGGNGKARSPAAPEPAAGPVAEGAPSDVGSPHPRPSSSARPHMRFAYIDSQGNEVSIPSVDALRLRIELGAIVDATMFLDGHTGKRAPAGEHEIYRTLRRELRDLEAGGFVPPPPLPDQPVTEPVDSGEGPAPVGGDDPAGPGPVVENHQADPGPEAELPGNPDLPGFDVPPATAPSDPELPDGPPRQAADVDPADDFGFGLDLELVSGFGENATPTLARDRGGEGEVTPLPEAPDGSSPPGAGSAPLPGRMEGLETGPPLSAVWTEGIEASGDEPIPAAAAQPDAHAPDPPGADAMEPVENLGNMHPDFLESPPDADPVPTEHAGPADLALEPSLADGYRDDLHGGGSAPPPTPAMRFETPPAADDEERPPNWVTGDSPAHWGEPLTSDEVADDPLPLLDIREPAERPRTAPPKRKLTRAGTPGAGRVAALVLAAVAVGVGGWFGWDRFVAGGGTAGAGVEVLNLPAIPQELMPTMRQLSAGAVAATVDRLGGLPERQALPPAPDGEWLAGRYLAGAGAFPSIPGYWRGVLSYVSAVQSAADDLFESELDRGIAESGLTEEEAALVRGRARAGWAAASPERQVVFRQMQAVATTALELHQFLVGNQDQIAYEPAAAGVSRDPVLEAVPATEALGAAMGERVGDVIEALDDMGFLDTITTDGLVEAFLARVEATPVR